MTSSLIIIIACLLDYILGEPKRLHPLVGFGSLVKKLEQTFNPAYLSADAATYNANDSSANSASNQHKAQASPVKTRIIGLLCWLILTTPLPLLYYFLYQDTWLFWLFDCLILYMAIGYNSLRKHARQILIPLTNGDIKYARHYCSYIGILLTSPRN